MIGILKNSCVGKIQKNYAGSISIGPFDAPLSTTEQTEIQKAVELKVLEDAPISVYNVDRSIAEGLYHDTIFDEFGVPFNLTKLRLVLLQEWNINCNRYPVLSSTGYIKHISLQEFIHDPEKSVVSIEKNCRRLERRKFAWNSLACQIKINFELIPHEKECQLAVDVEASSPDALPTLDRVIPFVQLNNTEVTDQFVTPWEVKTSNGSESIDYNNLIVSLDLIRKIEAITHKKAHYLLRRQIFFAHRDLDILIDAYAHGQKFYLYTGRGPSSACLHIGHLIPFIFTKALQETFNVPLVIQLTDDEKFLFKETLALEEAYRFSYENAKEIIAIGFDVEKTFIFSNLDYIKYLYPTVLRIYSKLTANQVRGIFGFDEKENVGKFCFPAVEAAPAFGVSFPTLFGSHAQSLRCLVPQAIDQDPYFRMTRDIAPRLGYLKPAVIHSKGLHTKMSASGIEPIISLDDSAEKIKHVIMKYAFSGGGVTVEEHRKNGANLDVDVPFQYLKFFLEDDQELSEIESRYKCGDLLTGDVKNKLVEVLVDIIGKHQERKARITQNLIEEFMNPHRDSFLKNLELCREN